jgi:flagellar motor switch protein FliN/FliY
MSLIDTIQVELSVVIGSTDLPIRQLLKIGRGATIQLDASHDDPSLLYVNDELVARGDVRVNGEHIEVEISHVVKRARS